MIGAARRSSVEVPCTIEIENTLDSLHAYVELEGVEVGPGDEVRVLDAPTQMPPYGERLVCERRATVVRAGWLDRRVDPPDLALSSSPSCTRSAFPSWRCP